MIHSLNSEEVCATDNLTLALEDLAVSPNKPTVPHPTTITPLGGSGPSAPSTPQYQGPCYPSAYISTTEEYTAPSQTSHATQLLERYRLENPDSPRVEGSVKTRRGGGRGKEESGGGERYEKALARHGDGGFLKFQKELSKCPEQIIRSSIA